MSPPGGGAFLNTKYSWQTSRGKTAEGVVFRTKTSVKQQDSLSLILGTEIKASSEQFYNSERTGCSKATPWLLPSNNCKERSLLDACSQGGEIGDCNLLGFHERNGRNSPRAADFPQTRHSPSGRPTALLGAQNLTPGS